MRYVKIAVTVRNIVVHIIVRRRLLLKAYFIRRSLRMLGVLRVNTIVTVANDSIAALLIVTGMRISAAVSAMQQVP